MLYPKQEPNRRRVGNKRSDPIIHAFCQKCRKRPIEELLDEGRALFNYQGEAGHHLVVSNWKRRRINTERNKALKPENSRLLKAMDSPIYLYVGLQLQGCCTKNGIYDGIPYEVIKLDKKSMTIKEAMPDNEKEIEVTYEAAK